MTLVRERAAPQRPLESQSAQYIDESELPFTTARTMPGADADPRVDRTTDDVGQPAPRDSRLPRASNLPDRAGRS